MPSYYADVRRGSEYTSDLKGFEAKDEAEAQAYARMALIDLVRNSRETLDHIKLSATVSDKRRISLFHIVLSLDLNWPD